MYFNFGNNLIDGGDDVIPQKQSPAPTPTPTPSFRFSDAYLDYRTGERQSTVVDEQTKLAGMRNADIQAKAQKAAEEAANRAKLDAELAADRAAAKKAQEDAAQATRDAQEAYRAALEAQAKARQAQAEAEAEAARKAAEEAERLRRERDKNKYDNDYSPSNNTYSPPVAPIPLTPSTFSSQPSNISPVTQTPPPPPVKTAPIDTILFDEEAVPIQIMSDLIFENIGGQELINIARNDTVNGQQIIYQPIKNLTQIQQQYNPNNIVALQATSDKYFQNFAIKFESKVPTEGNGPDGSHVYIDPITGSLVVEAINMQDDEQIEVEITTGGTIYEAEL
jgi:flagellar biosynthesis GTPase FlhF